MGINWLYLAAQIGIFTGGLIGIFAALKWLGNRKGEK